MLQKFDRVAQAKVASIKHKGVKTVHLAASVVPPLQLLQAPLNQSSWLKTDGHRELLLLR
jgi:hypothetical protein